LCTTKRGTKGNDKAPNHSIHKLSFTNEQAPTLATVKLFANVRASDDGTITGLPSKKESLCFEKRARIWATLKLNQLRVVDLTIVNDQLTW
jgi:hypothetical protein